MKQFFKNYISRIVSDDNIRLNTQMIIFFMITSFLGAIMSIINIIKHLPTLATLTGLLCLFSIIGLITLKLTKERILPNIIIISYSIIMLSHFIYDGGIDGFSPFWAVLFPFAFFFLFGKKSGTKVSITVFILIASLLWTPLNNYLKYDYTDTFLLRFPILYFGSFMTGYSFEFIRYNTFLKLSETVSELQKLSRIDSLTGLENRRAFDNHLNELWQFFLNNDRFLSILMIDIDYFKYYNDYYGHLAGDDVLKKIALILNDNIDDQKGIVSRWGGEEFVVLLPFFTSDVVLKIAETLVSKIESAKIPHHHTLLENKVLTVSIGVATALPNHTLVPLDLLDFADKSLYDAKNSGRNKVGKIIIK